MDHNMVVLAGRLVREPELVHGHADGVPMCVFTLAINRKKPGDKLLYVTLTAYRGQAVTVSKLSAGSPILVSGSLERSDWRTKQGVSLSHLEVVVDRVQFLDRSKVEEEMPVEYDHRS